MFVVKQKTAYEMRISDWSSDVCSSDLNCRLTTRQPSSPVCIPSTAASTSRIRPCSLAARAPSSQTVSANLISRPRPLLWLQSTQGISPTVTYRKQPPGGGSSTTTLTTLDRGACALIAATPAACSPTPAGLIGPPTFPAVRTTAILPPPPHA